MSSALAAPPYCSVRRQPDSDAITIRLTGAVPFDTALRRGVDAVYGVLVGSGEALPADAAGSACRALKSELPDASAVAATALQVRVVVLDGYRSGKSLGVEASLISGGHIPAAASAAVPLTLCGLQHSFDTLTAL